MLKTLKVSNNIVNNYCLLDNISDLYPKVDENDMVINYPAVEAIDQKSTIYRKIFMENLNFGVFRLLFPILNILDITLNYAYNIHRYHNMLNILVRVSDKFIEKNNFYRFNMPLEKFAERLDLLYNYSNKILNNVRWLFVNLNISVHTINAKYLTPAARIASTLGDDYAKYAQETMLDVWKNNDCKIYLLYIHKNNKIYGFSLQDIRNAIVNDVFKMDDDTEFPIEHVNDLISLLKDSNYTLFTPLYNMLQKVVVHKRNLISKNFTSCYNNLNDNQQTLLKKYFYCYFMLVNYSRFWLGPGTNMDHDNVSPRSLLLLYRERQIQRIIYLLQSYREEITLFMNENWDNNLYLLSDFDNILPTAYQNIVRMGVTTTYNCSKLYDRIQLLSEGLFCMAIFCEQAKYIINSIIVYLGKSTNIKNSRDFIEIKSVMQSFTDEILPLIVNDLLNTNNYQKQVINPTHEYNIYTRMFAYYYLLKREEIPVNFQELLQAYLLPLYNEQKQLLTVPLFVFPNDYDNLTITDNQIINLPIDKVKECHQFLNLEVKNNNSYELFTKAYDYYSVVFEYQVLTDYINNKYKQNIGNLQQYHHIYHTSTIDDVNDITKYVNYY